MIRPVAVVGIDIGAVNVIELTCLEKIGGRYLCEITVEGDHILAELDYSGRAGHIVGAVLCLACAEGKPAYAVIIDDHTGVKGVRAVGEAFGIVLHQRLAERILPGTERVGRGYDSRTCPVIGKVKIKMRQPVILNS